MHCNVSNLHHRPLCVVGVYALHSLNVVNIQGGSQKLVTVIFTITLANVDQFLGERYYVTLRSPYVIANPHVLCLSVCLSSVCLSRWCTPLRVEHFGDVFAPSNRLATRTACAKLLERNLKGLCDVIVQESGMKNQRFPTNISHFILETIQGTAIVTMEEMNRTNSYAIC